MSNTGRNFIVLFILIINNVRFNLIINPTPMKTIFRINIIILLTGVILCSSKISLYAQQGESLIYGSVVAQYSSGEVVLNGATIEIYSKDSLFVTTKTSESGNFSFNKMPYGIYYLKVRKMEEINQTNQKQQDSSTEQPIKSGEGKYYSFQESVKSTRIKFSVNSPESNLSKIIVYPIK